MTKGMEKVTECAENEVGMLGWKIEEGYKTSASVSDTKHVSVTITRSWKGTTKVTGKELTKVVVGARHGGEREFA